VNRQISTAARWLLLQALLLGCSARGFVDEREAAASHPFARHALPEADRHWISGQVQERMLAGNYVYLRLREASGSESWLVSLEVTTPKAQEVRALVVGRAAHFHSRQLERDFSPLLFAAVRSVAN
jgi:hypothetical protein